MLDYPAARAVAMVVRTGSFEKAAKALNVTPSAVSQRVKQLEERLGAALIERGPPCTATETGEWLCRHMDHVAMLEKELAGRLPGLADPDTPSERVTIALAANSDSLGTWLVKALAPFARNSGYLLNIAVDDEDHTAEWLQRGRVLAAVTSLSTPVRGCRVMPLGALRYHATASPDFMAHHFPDGVTPRALAQAPALTFNHKDRMQAEWAERVFGRSCPCPTHWLPSTQGFVDASVAGMGWCLNPAALIADHLAAGRLMELVPGTPFDKKLFWQISRIAADRLDGLTRSIITTARSDLIPDHEARE